MDVSRYLMPVMFTAAIVYSFGIRAVGQSISLGSSEVGLVDVSAGSWAWIERTDKIVTSIVPLSLRKISCMVDCSERLKILCALLRERFISPFKIRVEAAK